MTARNLTKDEMIARLHAGCALCVDRKDAPELPELLELEAQGLVESRLVEIDEQSSFLKFRWRSSACGTHRNQKSMTRSDPYQAHARELCLADGMECARVIG